jgi:signal peptidase II
VKRFVWSVYPYLVPAILIVILDELIKAHLLTTLSEKGELLGTKFISLGIHKNFGIAFDIPFRIELIFILSIAIGIVLIHTAYQHRQSKPVVSFCLLLIIIGALGNLYDRVIYGFTIDYLIFFERSAVNLSDGLIIGGVIALLMNTRSKKSQKNPHI